MPLFHCRLAAEDGSVAVRSFPAASAVDCRRHFEAEGLCVLSVRRDWRRPGLSALGRDRKVKDRDFITFNQEFAAMLRAGYPALRCLEAIAGRTKTPALRAVLGRVENDVRHGKALSEAFAPFEPRFGKVYTAALMAGERGGTLPDTIGQYIGYAKTIDRTRRRIRSAMIYPAVLLGFSLALLLIILNFVLPNFSEFFADFETQLPLISLLLIELSLFVRRNALLWPILAAGLAFLYARMRKSEKANLRIERLKLRVPFARPLIVESAVSLYGRTLSLLLGAGIPLVEAAGLSAQAIPNKDLAMRLGHVSTGLRHGEAFSETLAKADFFPPLALDLVRIGETSANLGGMLKELAEVTEERIQQKLDTLVSLIEPVIIILMGGLVAGMLLAVYLPIFRIISVAR